MRNALFLFGLLPKKVTPEMGSLSTRVNLTPKVISEKTENVTSLHLELLSRLIGGPPSTLSKSLIKLLHPQCFVVKCLYAGGRISACKVFYPAPKAIMLGGRSTVASPNRHVLHRIPLITTRVRVFFTLNIPFWSISFQSQPGVNQIKVTKLPLILYNRQSYFGAYPVHSEIYMNLFYLQ